MKKQRWICCQIGSREHYAVPRALRRHGALDLLLTDAWVHPTNPLGMLNPGLHLRFHRELASSNVYAPTARNILFELRARFAGLRDWSLVIARNEWFQRLAVARLSRLSMTGRRRTVM